jgi:hypothetical protein
LVFNGSKSVFSAFLAIRPSLCGPNLGRAAGNFLRRQSLFDATGFAAQRLRVFIHM